MPPRTRTRATKDLKENVEIVKKTKVKSNGKICKPPRKALADKTNSLSDDNASIDVPIKTAKIALQKTTNTASKEENRPRRERRLPTRYVENPTLKNLSNSKTPVKNQSLEVSKPISNSTPINRQVIQTSNKEVLADRPKRNHRLESNKQPVVVEKPETPSKQISKSNISPFKTPSQSLDGSLIANRPKRICRLPSKFEDHSISPNKFIPVQPCHASTPIIQKKAKTQTRTDVSKPNQEKRPTRRDIVKKDVKTSKGIEHYFSKSQKNNKPNNVKDTSANSKNKTSPDTNNNPKGKKTESKKVISTKSPTKQISPKADIKKGLGKRLLEHNLSFRVFEDKKSDKGEDVYEFTFDPKDEPQKKKRKKVVKKRPPKPKTEKVSKNNYEKNVQKALESLKNMVKTQSQAQSAQIQTQAEKQKNPAKIHIIEDVIIKPAVDNKSLNYTPAHPTNDSAKSIHMSNYASIHIEDIAADFEMDDNHMNYSPVNSPLPPKTPEIHNTGASNIQETHEKTGASNIQDKSPVNKEANVDRFVPAVNNKDPLNLQEDHSFFEDQPVASSSMNVSARSVRHPLASPWRVEFGDLPIRWQADTYVKPNMTPAVESSFINSEEISKKKHVYTNLVAEEPLPVIEEPQLKQTSIISFMKEVAERSLKKKRDRSMSPTKANSLFEDMGNASDFGFKTPKKARKDKVVVTPSNKSTEKTPNHEHNEISNENINHEENIEQNQSPQKMKENKDGTFFGFDESDQENVSPIKILNTRTRTLRSKSRAVLQEINAMTGPIRGVLPVSAKSKLPSSDVVEKLYVQLKSAEEAPLIQEKEKDNETVTNEPVSDDESVHLFEDIELIHHFKPQRKSYGKAKKVTFRQPSNSDSDTQIQHPEGSSDEDDLADLTFHVPNVKEKKVAKKKKKKQLSKKEEKEVEEWAAGFNSMCEDIDDFPLVVE